jgi:hypothetical protein
MNEREEIYLTCGFIQACSFYNQAGEKPELAGLKDQFLKNQVLPKILNQISLEELQQIIAEVDKSSSYMRVIEIIKQRVDRDKMMDILKSSKLTGLDSLR